MTTTLEPGGAPGIGTASRCATQSFQRWSNCWCASAGASAGSIGFWIRSALNAELSSTVSSISVMMASGASAAGLPCSASGKALKFGSAFATASVRAA